MTVLNDSSSFTVCMSNVFSSPLTTSCNSYCAEIENRQKTNHGFISCHMQYDLVSSMYREIMKKTIALKEGAVIASASEERVYG